MDYGHFEIVDYKIEDLLPIVAELTEKYTSKESSSVSYETARMLMEAVIYNLNQALIEVKDTALSQKQQLAAKVLYERGCDIVLRKAQEAKEIFEAIAADFEDYRCANYKETVIDGMRGFFKKYDRVYNPQDHILTMDYPLLTGNPQLSGVALIYEYLKGIRMEIAFLNYFPQQSICELLDRRMPGYEKQYMDNLCEPVLLNAVCCVIADQSIQELLLEEGALAEIKDYFSGDDRTAIKVKIEGLIRMLTKEIPEYTAYFLRAAANYAARIETGIIYGNLRNVVILKE